MGVVSVAGVCSAIGGGRWCVLCDVLLRYVRGLACVVACVLLSGALYCRRSLSVTWCERERERDWEVGGVRAPALFSSPPLLTA